MELTSTVFDDVLGPLAAFPTSTSGNNHRASGNRESDGRDDNDEDENDKGGDWAVSPVNPQSRIGSLISNKVSTWRVDEVDVDGRRLFVAPAFAIGKPPLRVDLILPPVEAYPRPLRDVLQPEKLLYVKREKVVQVPAVQHVLRALERWSGRQPDFEHQYYSLPFGSQIIVGEVTASVDDMAVGIYLCPDYDVEQAMLTIDQLRRMWDIKVWPPSLDLGELRFERQLHEAISLVTILRDDYPDNSFHSNSHLRPSRLETSQADGYTSGSHSDNSQTNFRTNTHTSFHSGSHPDRLYPDPHPSRELVFKSLTRDQRYMYNELRMLLTLTAHPNVISRPKYIITKRGRFGGKHGVCGFILEYYPLGSLKQRLLDGSVPSLGEKIRWCRQITQALIHINNHPGGFYPDLKPDNLVLRAASDGTVDIVLLDLEQRGGWYAWSPPEVLYLEYMEALAAGLGDSHAEFQDEIRGLLARHYNIPGWKPGTQRDRYQPSLGGFSAPWLELLRRQQETGSAELDRAQVFMLGKLVWCIFEGTPMVRCGIDYELLQDANEGIRFPDFKDSPEGIQSLVRRCTLGAPEWEATSPERIVLRLGRLVSMDQRGEIMIDKDAKSVAARWWAGEVARATRFLRVLVGDDEEAVLDQYVRRRSTLAEVLGQLVAMEREWDVGWE